VMQDVAVLGVADAHERAVGRDAAATLPSSSERPTATTSPASAIPIAQPSGTSGTSGRGSLPPKGAASHRPFSSPVASCHQTTNSPSGVMRTSSTPMCSSDSRRCVPSSRSAAHACPMPDSLEMNDRRSGRSVLQRGSPTRGAV
jgi:hypothetical protein